MSRRWVWFAVCACAALVVFSVYMRISPASTLPVVPGSMRSTHDAFAIMTTTLAQGTSNNAPSTQPAAAPAHTTDGCAPLSRTDGTPSCVTQCTLPLIVSFPPPGLARHHQHSELTKVQQMHPVLRDFITAVHLEAHTDAAALPVRAHAFAVDILKTDSELSDEWEFLALVAPVYRWIFEMRDAGVDADRVYIVFTRLHAVDLAGWQRALVALMARAAAGSDSTAQPRIVFGTRDLAGTPMQLAMSTAHGVDAFRCASSLFYFASRAHSDALRRAASTLDTPSPTTVVAPQRRITIVLLLDGVKFQRQQTRTAHAPRTLLNARALRAALETWSHEHNVAFECVHAGDLHAEGVALPSSHYFAPFVRALSTADLVVAVHAPHLASLFLLQPRAALIELLPHAYRPRAIAELCAQTGVAYHALHSDARWRGGRRVRRREPCHDAGAHHVDVVTNVSVIELQCLVWSGSLYRCVLF